MTKSICGTLCEVFAFGGLRLEVFRVVPLFGAFVSQKCGTQRPKCGTHGQNAVRTRLFWPVWLLRARLGFLVPFAFGFVVVSKCSTVFSGHDEEIAAQMRGTVAHGGPGRPQKAKPMAQPMPGAVKGNHGCPRRSRAANSPAKSKFHYPNCVFVSDNWVIYYFGMICGMLWHVFMCICVSIHISICFR